MSASMPRRNTVKIPESAPDTESMLAAFERFAEPSIPSDELPHNYCPECRVPMALACGEYQCSCGIAVNNEVECAKDHNAVAAAIRISSGVNSGKFYNVTADYTKTQRKAIMAQLMTHQTRYQGAGFPRDVLNATATSYNNIQKAITEEVVVDGVTKTKKFVRRGTIKSEILAALLFYECIRANIVRKKSDVAAFMELNTRGFSRGEIILRSMAVEGKIDMPIDSDERVDVIVEKYMEALDIKCDRYSRFVEDIVTLSEERRICMSSHLSSKVAGAMRVLISRTDLRVTDAELERATDNTKKNTFMRFHDAIFANMSVFIGVFAAHGISVR